MFLLSSCSEVVADMVIMQIRNDIHHGKEAPLMLASVEFLDSYYKSISLAGKFIVEEIVKGKMPSVSLVSPRQKASAAVMPWPAPPQGSVALSVDGSFHPEDRTAAAGMVLRNHEGVILFCSVQICLSLQ